MSENNLRYHTSSSSWQTTVYWYGLEFRFLGINHRENALNYLDSLLEEKVSLFQMSGSQKWTPVNGFEDENFFK